MYNPATIKPKPKYTTKLAGMQSVPACQADVAGCNASGLAETDMHLPACSFNVRLLFSVTLMVDRILYLRKTRNIKCSNNVKTLVSAK